jgi:hypothetical protein
MFGYILHQIGNVIVESWLVLGQMSPYLLFGFLMAGVLSVCFSPEWIERHLGGRGFGPVLKASLLGVPLPLCSCGVIPQAASIRRHGASRAAAISFLISTPQTGVDSIAVTWGLLGPVFAVIRPVAAMLTGLLGGGLVQLFGEKEPLDAAGHPVKPNACAESCCADKEKHNVFIRALRFGFLTLPRDLGKSLLLGVCVAGAINAIVPANAWQPYLGGGIVSILVMIALGIPLYVCATASVAFAASLIHAGVSPGAALAFLISGPATNAATIVMTWKLLGKRTVFVYLATIALSAVFCGLAVDWFFPSVVSTVPGLTSSLHNHSHLSGWISHVWSIALLSVIAFSYGWPVKTAADSHDHGHEHEHDHENGDTPVMSETNGNAPQRLELAITGMTCSHCAAAVTRAIEECEGVQSAEVSLKDGRAAVAGVNLDSQKLLEAVKSLGYEAKLHTKSDNFRF